MKTCVFRVVVEPDEDRWSAHCPVLAHLGAATWGNTEEEALTHIQEVGRTGPRLALERPQIAPEAVV